MQDPPRSPTPHEQPPPAPPVPPAGPSAPPAGPPPVGPSAVPRPGGGARWGEPGYQAPPDPDRQSRLAVAWIVGILGALGLAVAALGGFAILYAMGQRPPAPVVGAPFPTSAPQPTAPPSTPGEDPTSTTSVAGVEDVTDSYRTQHPAERSTVQALAGQAGSLVTPEASIVISRLPSGADRGRSLDQLAADQVRALQHQGASGAGTLRHSTIGADPAVEVDLTIRSGGQPQRRTQVLCTHDGRLWQIAVTSPTGSQGLVTAAWTTVKIGWQWL